MYVLSAPRSSDLCDCEKSHCDLKVQISIASDCDLILPFHFVRDFLAI